VADRPDSGGGEETARVLQEVAERSSHILQEFGQKQFEQALSSAVKDELGVARAYMELWSRTLMDPSALAAASTKPLFIDCERLSGFKERGIDVDVVLDLMIHDLDLVLSLVKGEIAQISACGFQVLTDSIDIANVRIEFADGCVANLSASRVSQAPVRKLRVFQHDGYASADLQAGKLRMARRDARKGGIVEDEATFDDRDALRAEIEGFVDAVRSGRRPPVAGEDGRKALALALEVGRLVRARLERFKAVAA